MTKKRTDNFEIHTFICRECGNEGIPLPRRAAEMREKGHIKTFWCPTCQKDTDHVECKNDKELYEYRERKSKEKESNGND